MPVVTIARETGAGGADVGRLVADRLGAELVDAAIIDEVASRLRLPREEVEQEDEQPRSLVERLLRGMALADGPIGGPATMGLAVPADPHDEVVALTGQVIVEAARTGNAVVVGRGAGFVLHDLPEAIHVFLCASVDARVERLMRLWNTDDAAARRRLQEDDAKRKAYVREVHGREWRDPHNYHLTIDTSRVSFDQAADLIVTLATESQPTIPAGPGQGQG